MDTGRIPGEGSGDGAPEAVMISFLKRPTLITQILFLFNTFLLEEAKQLKFVLNFFDKTVGNFCMDFQISFRTQSFFSRTISNVRTLLRLQRQTESYIFRKLLLY